MVFHLGHCNSHPTVPLPVPLSLLQSISNIEAGVVLSKHASVHAPPLQQTFLWLPISLTAKNSSPLDMVPCLHPVPLALTPPAPGTVVLLCQESPKCDPTSRTPQLEFPLPGRSPRCLHGSSQLSVPRSLVNDLPDRPI